MRSSHGSLVEALETRRLMSAGISADKTFLIFNDPVGGSAAGARTITIKNTGSSPLSIPAGGITVAGAGASQFHLTSVPSLPATIAAGKSAHVSVNFGATKLGPTGATLQIKSNAANKPVLQLTLRGLGTRGLSGSNEPSLQWILDTYQIPVRTGDSTPAESTLDEPPKHPNDEVTLQRLIKAGPGEVTIQPIAVFSNPASPALSFGYYTLPASSPITRKQLFTVLSADVQTLNPRAQGTTHFDSGSTVFGLFSSWPAQKNRVTYSEDSRNTWQSNASLRREMRFYPLKNANGSVVPNAYVMGNEEAFNHDFQDGVFIIRNVKAAK